MFVFWFRYCSLIFDEVSLSSGLNFDGSADLINGFVNSGFYKSQELADHALVFMIRGIKKKNINNQLHFDSARVLLASMT